jgi:hypothetical protein
MNRQTNASSNSFVFRGINNNTTEIPLIDCLEAID